ncbi:MAG: Chloramphenicol phosphotransferase-like protein [Cyanobacteria bacterium RYN_339]|nr:Chloramphenicol phosphotransferase-like protein [Cyanobacteria bacterium RYN_339]
MEDWQVLILSGPIGSGKASVGQKLCQAVPGSQFVQVYRSRTAMLSLSGDTARDAALEAVRGLVETGQRVVIDDVIETPVELAGFFDALPDMRTVAVTLMPSLEEMERRDAIKPVGQQAGPRVAELYHAMASKLAERSTVLDTTDETVEDTVQRVLAALG